MFWRGAGAIQQTAISRERRTSLNGGYFLFIAEVNLGVLVSDFKFLSVDSCFGFLVVPPPLKLRRV